MMMLPGPPGELKPLFTNECIPRLLLHLPPQVIRTRFYRVAGMGESDLDALIAPVYTKFTNPATTILAGAGDIQVHLRARAATAEEAEAMLAEVGPPIEQLLGDRIYSHQGETLEAVVGNRLRERGATLSVAESCTGGMLAERITSIAGSSDYFVGGFLVYSDRMKTELLGVDAAMIAQHSPVSEEVGARHGGGGAGANRARPTRSRSRARLDPRALRGPARHGDPRRRRTGRSGRSSPRPSAGRPEPGANASGQTALDFLRKTLNG